MRMKREKEGRIRSSHSSSRRGEVLLVFAARLEDGHSAKDGAMMRKNDSLNDTVSF